MSYTYRFLISILNHWLYSLNFKQRMLHTTSICYPWVRTGIKYEHTYDGLKQEITDFYNYIRPRSYERYIRTELFNIIRSLLKATFPDIKVEMYGSFKTDIFLPTSDIDIVVYGNWEHLPLNAFRTTLLRSGLCTPGSLVILERALVPIIKFRSIQYNLKIDITFNTINAPKSAAYIQSLLATNPAIKILVMTLKQFLLQRDANEVYHGGISSYALLLMVAAFIKVILTQNLKFIIGCVIFRCHLLIISTKLELKISNLYAV